jgi:hypothetical protein
MARAIDLDPMRKYKFHTEFGVKGETLGLMRIDVEPEGPFSGPGWVHLTGLLTSELTAFLQKDEPDSICVGLFGKDGKHRTMSVILEEVRPNSAHLAPFSLDAASADILTVTVKMRYTALKFLLGDSPLVYLAAVAEDEGQK